MNGSAQRPSQLCPEALSPASTGRGRPSEDLGSGSRPVLLLALYWFTEQTLESAPLGPARLRARHTRPARHGWRELPLQMRTLRLRGHRRASPRARRGLPRQAPRAGGRPRAAHFQRAAEDDVRLLSHAPLWPHTDARDTFTEQRPRVAMQVGGRGRGQGASKPRLPPTRSRGASVDPAGGITRATVPWGDPGCESNA